jgi:hypothetical protein
MVNSDENPADAGLAVQVSDTTNVARGPVVGSIKLILLKLALNKSYGRN